MMSELGPRMVAYYQPVVDAPEAADAAPTFVKVTGADFDNDSVAARIPMGSTTDAVPDGRGRDC